MKRLVFGNPQINTTYSVFLLVFAVDGSLLIQRHVCVLMVDDSWRKLLGAFQAVIHQGCGEFLVLQILKGYQSILQACASLQVVSALNAFLTSLCDLGLPLAVKTVKPQGSHRGGMYLY